MVDQLNAFSGEVTRVAREVGTEGKLGGQATVRGVTGTWQDLTNNVNTMANNLTTQVRAIAEIATAVTKGDLTRSITIEVKGEVDALKNNLNTMITTLKETTSKTTEQDWLKTNLTKFTRMLQGQRDLVTVSQNLLSELAPVVSAHHGVFYVMEHGEKEMGMLKFLSAYAYKERKHLAQTFKIGEGLVGQCAFEKQRILITQVPSDYIQISSGLGEATPLNIVVLPILFEGKVMAVVEIASFNRFSDIHLSFLEQLSDGLGIILNTIQAAARTEKLLSESQVLTEELSTRQGELKQTNEELEDKARLLEEQTQNISVKNTEIEAARKAIETKANELAITSKYKSEFLSNMSHELRTPLNSLLLLSRSLSENLEKNLTEKQVRYAEMIHASGGDLLALINDILDLSKIEAGKVELTLESVSFSEIRDQVSRTFQHLADSKGIGFPITLSPNLPAEITTDRTRLFQVLKNLLSNALKFTERGEVRFSIERVVKDGNKIAFSISDTGIGIPANKQAMIFEAFQQVEGGTARKYGGTGLGLSISREIANLLGGALRLTQSEEGVGSTFVLYIPLQGSGGGGAHVGADLRVRPTTPETDPTPDGRTTQGARTQGAHTGAPLQSVIDPMPAVPDDRDTLAPTDQVLLIVEDDIKFAAILLDTARAKGFKGVVATSGNMALSLMTAYPPDAITLDIHLPDISGWVVLDRIKKNPLTSHIPIHVISVETSEHEAVSHGAIGLVIKPVTQEGLNAAFASIRGVLTHKLRRLLVVEDVEIEREEIVRLIGNHDVEATAVATGESAWTALSEGAFDCLVLDLRLPDISGFELLHRIRKDERLKKMPVIVYTGKDLTRKEEKELARHAQTIIIKSVKSHERLLAEAALFLHRVVKDLPPEKRKILTTLYETDTALSGKVVLLVDDDVRNLYALTGLLERYQMQILTAENGELALTILAAHPEIEVVLMDIMMPVMDGYETIRRIRANKNSAALPIIAVTAKAMKGDREMCITAGANDYLTKPVDPDQLISLLRIWTYKTR